MKQRILMTIGLGLLLALLIGGVVLAQGTEPPAKPSKAPPSQVLKERLGFRGPFLPFGGWQTYDAIAAALKLTPAQLFEQLHSGKTLTEIAAAQGMEMTAVQDAMKAARQTQARDAIQKAQESGKITKERADWMLKGLENGWNKPILPNRRGR